VSGFVEIDANPVPPGGRVFQVDRPDGARIRAAHWPGGERGTVLLLNGRTEFIEKYFEVVGELQARGYAVLTLDWRGQGLSSRALADPYKGHVEDFTQFLDDLDAVISAAGPLAQPLYMLAHSMGGNIGLRFLLRHRGRVRRAVLSAPMTGILTPAAPGPVVRALGGVMSAMGGRGLFATASVDQATQPFEDNPVTRDPGRFARAQALVRAEPRLKLGAVTWGWLRAAYRSIDAVMRAPELASLETPVLILSADDERFVDTSSHAVLAARLSHARHEKFPGARHEILMERDEIRAAALGMIFDFLEGREAGEA
jgi:lysophospholipase